MTWSELIRPPRLQHTETDAGKQRTATWLELFFDLAFVWSWASSRLVWATT
jgi:low temperature requirement protein LtrA